jgi:hypothetical protein
MVCCAGPFRALQVSLINVAEKDPTAWNSMPFLYANALWTLTYYPSSKHNPKFDGMTNNAHCLMYGFKQIMPLLMDLFQLGQNELANAFESLWTLSGTLLVSGWTNFSDAEFIPESVPALIMTLHQVRNAHIACALI